MKSLKQVIKRVAHAAALIFGAWWLVATSVEPEPPHDCFTGFADRTRLQVTLDATPPAPNPNPNFSLCGALDGLMPGSTLVFDISKSAYGGYGGCFDYDTLSITPTPPGVTLQGASPYNNGWDLTDRAGTFSLPTQSACRGSWSLLLSPETEPVRDHPISPLDAGPTQKWFVRRTMTIAQAQFCDGMIDGSGEVSCSDKFVVASITDLGAP